MYIYNLDTYTIIYRQSYASYSLAAEASCSILNLLLVDLGIHFPCEGVNGSQVDGHVARISRFTD